jgi:hypothetical protein
LAAVGIERRRTRRKRRDVSIRLAVAVTSLLKVLLIHSTLIGQVSLGSIDLILFSKKSCRSSWCNGRTLPWSFADGLCGRPGLRSGNLSQVVAAYEQTSYMPPLLALCRTAVCAVLHLLQTLPSLCCRHFSSARVPHGYSTVYACLA